MSKKINKKFKKFQKELDVSKLIKKIKSIKKFLMPLVDLEEFIKEFQSDTDSNSSPRDNNLPNCGKSEIKFYRKSDI